MQRHITYHKDVAVITHEEAYQELKSGALKSHSNDSVSIISCTMDYEIDTKGFYQPVYYFNVASPDGSYLDRIMISAM